MDKHKLDKKDRIAKALVIMLSIFIILIVVGLLGFMYLFNLDALTSLFYASLILTAIDLPEQLVVTKGQKWFIIFYAFASVIIFLSIADVTLQYLFTLL